MSSVKRSRMRPVVSSISRWIEGGSLHLGGPVLDLLPEVDQVLHVGCELGAGAPLGRRAADQAGVAGRSSCRIPLSRCRSSRSVTLRETPMWLSPGMSTR